MKYEINIKLTANTKPKLDELNDFLFCRIRDNDLKYAVTVIEEPMLLQKDGVNDKKLT